MPSRPSRILWLPFFAVGVAMLVAAVVAPAWGQQPVGDAGTGSSTAIWSPPATSDAVPTVGIPSAVGQWHANPLFVSQPAPAAVPDVSSAAPRQRSVDPQDRTEGDRHGSFLTLPDIPDLLTRRARAEERLVRASAQIAATPGTPGPVAMAGFELEPTPLEFPEPGDLRSARAGRHSISRQPAGSTGLPVMADSVTGAGHRLPRTPRQAQAAGPRDSGTFGLEQQAERNWDPPVRSKPWGQSIWHDDPAAQNLPGETPLDGTDFGSISPQRYRRPLRSVAR